MAIIKKTHEILCIFTRFPRSGNTKTRLIPKLGPDKAAELQRLMTEHVFDLSLNVQEKRNVEIQVHYNGSTLQEIRDWAPEKMKCIEQCAGNLGEKMQQAINENFNKRDCQVVVIGADCPGLTPEFVELAFNALAEHDIVVGPSLDGGFYLIGMKKKCPFLLGNIDWDTDKTLEQVMIKVKETKMSYTVLETLEDIDRPEDLQYLKKHGINFLGTS